jgi:uncharacterized membrane protein (GlpM family)
MDVNIVEIWLRKDPVRWVAGALAGLFAAAIAMAFAVLLSAACGVEPLFPAKLMGAIALGPSATEVGEHTSAILAGIVLFEVLGAFLGVVYAHFTGTNLLHALLGVGFVWGVFSWIFIWNLFMQSFRPIYWVHVSSGATFPVCLVFGLSLTSVAFFDQALRGNRT